MDNRKLLQWILGASIIIGFYLGFVAILNAQQKKSTEQQLLETKFLLVVEKQDTEKLILEKASIQGAYDQTYLKLLEAQKIIKELVKDGKIKIEDLAPLTAIGFNFTLPEPKDLPSNLPDSLRQRNKDDLWP